VNRHYKENMGLFYLIIYILLIIPLFKPNCISALYPGINTFLNYYLILSSIIIFTLYFVNCKISRNLLLIILFLGVIQLICYPYNMSILLLSLYLKSHIKKEEFNMNIEFFKEIFSKEEFIIKNRAIETEIITVMENTTIQEILRQMKTERLYRINVVDERLNIVGEIAESQLMDIITEYGIRENIKYILSFK